MTRTSMARAVDAPRGFALLTVLWAVTVLTMMVAAAGELARRHVAASGNRTQLLRAGWMAEGCASQVYAVLVDILDEEQASAEPNGWADLDLALRARGNPAGTPTACTVALRPAGTGLDLNSADSAQLRRLFLRAGIAIEEVAPAVDAVLDWRDADDEPRPNGAEHAWYASDRRQGPRNGPFAAARELALVRGLDGIMGALDADGTPVIGVEPYRLSLLHAAPLALLSLPGMEPEAVAALQELRANRAWRSPHGGATAIDLAEVLGGLTGSSRDSLAAHYAELATALSREPEAWLLIVDAAVWPAEAASGRFTLELRLRRAGRTITVDRRRSWP